LFVTLAPCPVCSKHIQQLKVTDIIVLDVIGKHLDWIPASARDVDIRAYIALANKDEWKELTNRTLDSPKPRSEGQFPDKLVNNSAQYKRRICGHWGGFKKEFKALNSSYAKGKIGWP